MLHWTNLGLRIVVIKIFDNYRIRFVIKKKDEYCHADISGASREERSLGVLICYLNYYGQYYVECSFRGEAAVARLLYIVSQKVETRVRVVGLSATLSLVNRSWASIDVKFRATDPCSIFFYPE